MTIDDGHLSDSDSAKDSDQMEIDIQADKEPNSDSYATKDNAVDNSDNSSSKNEGREFKTETSAVDNSAAPSPLPTEKVSAKVEYCGGCDKAVDDAEEGICCDGQCERWFHLRCSGLNQSEYDELGRDENAKWACNKCSGKPPPVLQSEIKPLLSVRKDLTNPVTPTTTQMPKRKSIKSDGSGKSRVFDISNPAFLKPFDYGWKRELVFRSTNDSGGRRQGDVYYYTPKGKKLRSLREISEHVVGTDLTMDNFTFWKDSIGVDDPEKEIIRDAKFKLVNKESASPIPKKVVTPKVPKTPKVTPKLTATVTPLDNSGSTPSAPAPASITPKVSASVTPRIVFKGNAKASTGPKFKVTPSKTIMPGQAQKIVITKDKKKKSSSDDEMEIGMLPPTWDPMPKPEKKSDVCSIRCLPAMGLIPTLQCIVCLCLYHPECVGLEEAHHRPIHSYKCKNCQMEKPKPAASNGSSKAIFSPPPLTPISTLACSSGPATYLTPAPPKLQRLDGKPQGPRGRPPLTKATSIVGGVTTWLPPSSTIQLRTPLSKVSPSQKPSPPTTTSVVDSGSLPVQTLVVLDGKRFIMVPKHNVLSVSPATTTSVQVTDPVSSQVTSPSSDPVTVSASLSSQPFGPSVPILPKPQVSSPTTFIVGSPSNSTNFQNPPGVLLVPYIPPQTHTSPPQKDGQQPQYIMVNGPTGMQPGNFLFGNIPQQQQLKLPTVPTSQPAEPLLETSGVKRPLDPSEGEPIAKKAKIEPVSIPPTPTPAPVTAPPAGPSMQNFMQNISYIYSVMLHAFQYLKVQELLRCSRVCHLWRDIALHKTLWETVRMKNSTVKDWEGFSATLRRVGTKHLDMRKMLMPDKPEALKSMWVECAKALSKVNTLVKLDLCRCNPFLLEQIAAVCPQLEYIGAAAIKSNQMNLSNLAACQNLVELKVKSTNGIELTNSSVLANLPKLKQLSLTTVKNTSEVLRVVGKMTQLESLELGDLTNITKSDVTEALSKLTRLRRLRLEKGQSDCPTAAILGTISLLPNLVQLELINFDVKAGFEEALAKCSNIKILLIIPTYVTQSATTNHLVIEGVQKLSKTLNHFVWGLTLELLRVTDLFIDQWDQTHKTGEAKPPGPQKKSSGDSIPILKPQNKDGKKPPGKEGAGAVTQVDVLQLPKLHRVLTTLLPTTKIIILKVPFSATWRQTISGSSQ